MREIERGEEGESEAREMERGGEDEYMRSDFQNSH